MFSKIYCMEKAHRTEETKNISTHREWQKDCQRIGVQSPTFSKIQHEPNAFRERHRTAIKPDCLKMESRRENWFFFSSVEKPTKQLSSIMRHTKRGLVGLKDEGMFRLDRIEGCFLAKRRNPSILGGYIKPFWIKRASGYFWWLQAFGQDVYERAYIFRFALLLLLWPALQTGDGSGRPVWSISDKTAEETTDV